MRKTTALLVLAELFALASPALASIAIINAYTDAQVFDGTNSSDASSFSQTGDTETAILPALYSSNTTSVYSVTGDAANLSANFVHTRQGDFSAYAYSQAGFDFTVSVLSTYTAAGSYLNSSGQTLLSSYLFDADTSTYLYNNFQESSGSPASFTLGGSDGTDLNGWTGSLTGPLLAGHTYNWSGLVFTQAYPDVDLGAAASGRISLTVAPVPESSSLVVWSLLGLVFSGLCHWQKRRRRSGLRFAILDTMELPRCSL